MRQDSESLRTLLISGIASYDPCITDNNGKTAYDYLDFKDDFADSYLKCGD